MNPYMDEAKHAKNSKLTLRLLGNNTSFITFVQAIRHELFLKRWSIYSTPLNLICRRWKKAGFLSRIYLPKNHTDLSTKYSGDSLRKVARLAFILQHLRCLYNRLFWLEWKPPVCAWCATGGFSFLSHPYHKIILLYHSATLQLNMLHFSLMRGHHGAFHLHGFNDKQRLIFLHFLSLFHQHFYQFSL